MPTITHVIRLQCTFTLRRYNCAKRSGSIPFRVIYVTCPCGIVIFALWMSLVKAGSDDPLLRAIYVACIVTNVPPLVPKKTLAYFYVASWIITLELEYHMPPITRRVR
ncbi:hypothetical protein BDR03DRAFT_966399 [Suillus americanus]|nr:hypothetical protein BDR03DRAFT_966399 [Suillus americanus]